MRPRLKPWTLRLDAATERELNVRAAAHGVSRPEYARSAIAGTRPGGRKGQVAGVADAWWDNLPPSRRAQVYGWLKGGVSIPEVDAAQLSMFEEEA